MQPVLARLQAADRLDAIAAKASHGYPWNQPTRDELAAELASIAKSVRRNAS